MRCDFCNKEATCHGAYQSYLACDDHVKEGEAVEDRMFSAIESEPSTHPYIEFLRQT